jgi:hypothetical protein
VSPASARDSGHGTVRSTGYDTGKIKGIFIEINRI